MSAGTGVRHSEFNHSREEPVHLYQIWYCRKKKALSRITSRRRFLRKRSKGRLRLVASPSGGNGSNAVKLYQDAELYTVALGKSESVEHELRDGRYAWIQVARGGVNVRMAGDRRPAMELRCRRKHIWKSAAIRMAARCCCSIWREEVIANSNWQLAKTESAAFS